MSYVFVLALFSSSWSGWAAFLSLPPSLPLLPFSLPLPPFLSNYMNDLCLCSCVLVYCVILFWCLKTSVNLEPNNTATERLEKWANRRILSLLCFDSVTHIVYLLNTHTAYGSRLHRAKNSAVVIHNNVLYIYIYTVRVYFVIIITCACLYNYL